MRLLQIFVIWIFFQLILIGMVSAREKGAPLFLGAIFPLIAFYGGVRP